MADVFSSTDTKRLLRNRRMLFLGDSNIRAQYKDVVWLLNHNTLICKSSLRSKLEGTFQGDTLIERSKLHYGRDFQEERNYVDRNNGTVVDFVFLTRCYNQRLQELFKDFREKKRVIPDVIVINSCLWDLTRWGPNGVPQYKDNMVKLMRMIRLSLPAECLVIWTTALPLAPHVRGGLIIKQIECMEPLLRFEVMEANTFAKGVAVSYGFDVLDTHYFTRMQIHRRAKDGVHYLPIPVRFMTNLLLTHIALSWGYDLPHRVCSLALKEMIALEKQAELPAANIPCSGIFSKLQSSVIPRSKGLTITFSPQGDGERRRISFDVEPEITPSQEVKCFGFSSETMKSQNFQYPCSTIGPYRRKKRIKRKKCHPYYDLQYDDSHCNSYYNPNGDLCGILTSRDCSEQSRNLPEIRSDIVTSSEGRNQPKPRSEVHVPQNYKSDDPSTFKKRRRKNKRGGYF